MGKQKTENVRSKGKRITWSIIAFLLVVIVASLTLLTSIVPNGTYVLSHINFNGKDYALEEFGELPMPILPFTDFLFNNEAYITTTNNKMDFSGTEVDFVCRWGNIQTKGFTEISLLEKSGIIKFKYWFGKIYLKYNLGKIVEFFEEDEDFPNFYLELYKSFGKFVFCFEKGEYKMLK